MWLPFLQLLVSSKQPEGVAGPAGEGPRGRGAAVPQRKPWVLDGCRRLSGLLRQKAAVLNKLEDAIRAVERDASLSDQEKLFQVHTLEIFQKELNESENSVFQAVHGLQRALQGDYRDVANMRESSRQRLEALRAAAIKAGPGLGLGSGPAGVGGQALSSPHLSSLGLSCASPRTALGPQTSSSRSAATPRANGPLRCRPRVESGEDCQR